MSLEEYFRTGPERERPIFEAVIRHVEKVGPVHVEPVSVGIFLKRSRSFAELRPLRDWVALSFSLPYQAQHRCIVRKVQRFGGVYFHVANIRSADDLDAEILQWLTEAYLESPE